MSVNVKYKDNIIASLTGTGTKTLETAGTYCEADIVVENTKDSGGSTPKVWVRPSDWPDMDSLDISSEDAMYYTVDCRALLAAYAIDPDAEYTITFCTDTTGGTWTLERGKVENGAFTVISAQE